MLDLRGNKIGDTGMSALAGAITSRSALERLLLGRNQIGDVGVIDFSRAIAERPPKALKILDLNSNKFDDTAIIEFSHAIASGFLDHLNTLDLVANVNVGDSGIEAFAKTIAGGSLPPIELMDTDGADPQQDQYRLAELKTAFVARNIETRYVFNDYGA